MLQEKGMEVYCPLNKVRRQWSDRVKIVEEPLFKSYVFVKISDEERTEVRLTPGVINFIYSNGKPAQIKEKEIQAIKRFLNEHSDVALIPLEVNLNQKVKINAGLLMDKEGTVVGFSKKWAKVMIESLGCMLVANIDKKNLTAMQ